jgi:hypothetical protein
MDKRCQLEADGFIIYFNIKSTESEEHIDLSTEFIASKNIGNVKLKSCSTFITKKDLNRFSEYLENHIKKLEYDSDSESDIFVPMELGFQAQALEGEIGDKNNGEFSLRFLLNVGKDGAENHSVYMGGESIVTLRNARAFIDSLHEALVQFQNVKSTE